MPIPAKLLLAEDSLTIQKVFELTFRQSGISLTMVDNGIDAVRLAKEISPDLVIADVTLPGKDGFHVASELRSPSGGLSCPVLILAGTLAPFDEERFKSCGANGVLFKPFESQELVDKVEAMIRGSRESVPASGEKETDAPPAEEPWDFSDILTEAEKEAVSVSDVPPVEAGDRDGGVPSSAGGALSLGDFDVSLEDLEEMPEGGETEPKPPPPEEEEPVRVEPPPEVPAEGSRIVEHIEEAGFEDSPPAVTDLSPAMETDGELEEIEDGEAIAPSEEAPQPQPVLPAEEQPPARPAVVPEGPGPGGEISAAPAPSPQAGPTGEQLRELFSGRAQEIFRNVAAETVEKVMAEMAEKLTKELTEKIRQSVENVAWEVIPAITEALIREEIARIREKAGKESS